MTILNLAVASWVWMCEHHDCCTSCFLELLRTLAAACLDGQKP